MRHAWVVGLTVALSACQSQPSALDPATRQAIADTIRTVSQQMLVAMRGRNIDSVLAFYSKTASYAADGAIGDWDAVLRAAGPRYATYAKVDCRWIDPFRVDVPARTAAIVTSILHCEKADTAGKRWVEHTVRTEVLAPEDGRWRIIAFHESNRADSLKAAAPTGPRAAPAPGSRR